jgi:cephalosporin hydroxylase
MLGQVIRELFAHYRSQRSAGAAAPPERAFANPLEAYFFTNTGRGTLKWRHYFEVYHRHFAKFRERSPVVVEIGVAMGGSLAMWHHYFGPGTRVVGIDVDPACRQFAAPDTKIMIGDQGDPAFLASVRDEVPRIDILIDDGGHTMVQQIATFELLYPHVHAEGVYVCEDTHTSLWPQFGGGYRRDGTFLELAKGFIDRLHAWHSEEPGTLAVDAFTTSTFGVHFYDSIVVIEKRPMTPPQQLLSKGTALGLAADQPVRFRP